jgi:hypothetical protein
MVRLRTQLGESSEWREYQALNVNNQVKVAYFKNNKSLVSWVNAQAVAEKCICLGDGHDGLWNIYAQLATPEQPEAILDWDHLMENRSHCRRYGFSAGSPEKSPLVRSGGGGTELFESTQMYRDNYL